MSNRRLVGVTALLVGVVAALLLHGHGPMPPVFDGIPQPVSPYHWQSPPPDLRSGNVRPQPGEAIFPARNGQVAGGSVQTGDGQVVIYFGVGLLQASSSAQSVHCTVTPMGNPPAPPAGAQIRGNVYQIGCTEQPSGAQLQATGTYHLTLRYPTGAFQEIQYYDGTAWHALATTNPGGNPFAGATPTSFGAFAATAPAGAEVPGILAFLGRYLEFYGIILFVIIFGVVALIQEVRHRRKSPG